jgi:hypothetical protein
MDAQAEDRKPLRIIAVARMLVVLDEILLGMVVVVHPTLA